MASDFKMFGTFLLLFFFYFSMFLVFHVSVLHPYTVTSSVLCSMLVAATAPLPLIQ